MMPESLVESKPAVSVVMPCYNDGAFLNEAVNSVLGQTFQNFELIIVNDGSTDSATVALLLNYDRPRTRVIHTANQGPAAARNTGITAAKGEYVLPLDSDDLIDPTYLEKAVSTLESNPWLGLVTCNAEWFGDATGPVNLPAYSFQQLLIENLFVGATMFRRADWEMAGGYKTNVTPGYEDWDFWISIVELGRQVSQIPETLFQYRKRSGSLLGAMTREQKANARAQTFRNHPKSYRENAALLFASLESLHTQMTSAKKQVSEIIYAARHGQEVTLCDSSGPVAKLIPFTSCQK